MKIAIMQNGLKTSFIFCLQNVISYVLWRNVTFLMRFPHVHLEIMVNKKFRLGEYVYPAMQVHVWYHCVSMRCC